jgi:uncharacterized membrane protein
MIQATKKNIVMGRGHKLLRILSVLAMALLLAAMPLAGWKTAAAAGGLDLSTTYPGVTIKPGEDLTFDLMVENEGADPQNVALSVKSLPDGWEAYFEGGGNPVSRIYVNDAADESNTAEVSLVLTVPDDAAAGINSIVVEATGQNGASDALQLDVTVSEQEFRQGELTAQYEELEGASTSDFDFSMTLKNNNRNQESYSLTAQQPEGWQVRFTSSDGTQIASLKVDGDRSESITASVTPAANVEAGEYTIPVAAVSSREELKLNLKVTVTGTYDMTLTTPSGVVSADAVAGQQSAVTLTIQNTGTAELQNISVLSKTVPADWSVSFDKDKIDSLAAGESAQVTAYIKPANDAITGDYVVSLTASTNEVKSQADFRVSVKTSTLWGIIGVVIIAAVVIGLVMIFRKFGRR